MRLLLEHGADPKLTTEDGTTALMAAAGVGIWAPGENPGTDDEALAALKLAFEAGGGDVNAVDDNGETALHGAVYRAGSIAMLSFLIEKGARLDVRNKQGLDAADRRRRRRVHAQRAQALSGHRRVLEKSHGGARTAGPSAARQSARQPRARRRRPLRRVAYAGGRAASASAIAHSSRTTGRHVARGIAIVLGCA